MAHNGMYRRSSPRRLTSCRQNAACFLVAAPSAADALQPSASPSQDNFASGVNVEELWLLAPSPDRAGQVSVQWLPAIVFRGYDDRMAVKVLIPRDSYKRGFIHFVGHCTVLESSK